MADIITSIVALKADAQVNVSGNTIEEQLNGIEWLDGNPTNITNQQISDKQIELTAAEEAAEAQKATDKANAKAKLIAGEALTEAEADTIVI
jgi:Tfp pilus assembly protein PilN